MCLEDGLLNLLKQVFSPAVRLWSVRELLPQSRYVEVLQDFLELSDSTPVSDEIPETPQEYREQIQATLSEWVRTAQWHYFVPAIEIIFQIAYQENHKKALKTLSKAWPEHLTLSEEGFIHYRNQPLLQRLNPRSDPSEKEKSPTTAPLAEAESRKEMYQRIRQKRLLLLKQWESL